MMQHLVDSINDVTKQVRSGYHLTLRGLIEKLEKEDKDLLVVADLPEEPKYVNVGEPHSYRGHYSDLAFEQTDQSEITVEEFTKSCHKVLNTELTGYKGGEFLMYNSTPLWISDYGEASSLAIMDAVQKDNLFVLITKEVD